MNNKNKYYTSQYLRNWRIGHGLDQKEIASIIGCSSQTITAIEDDRVTYERSFFRREYDRYVNCMNMHVTYINKSFIMATNVLKAERTRLNKFQEISLENRK